MTTQFISKKTKMEFFKSRDYDTNLIEEINVPLFDKMLLKFYGIFENLGIGA